MAPNPTQTERARFQAVTLIFTVSSNVLGALRAGLMSAAVRPVAAVVWVGLGTVLGAVAVARVVPQLRPLPPLHTLRP